MKNKLIKIGMISITLLSAMLFSNKVEAKVCKIYKDYDLFLELTDSNVYDSEIASNGLFLVETETHTPAGLSKDATLIKDYQIQIVKENAGEKSWTLDTYWNNYKTLFDKGKEETLNTSKGDTTIIVYKTETPAEVTRYIRHGKWYEDGKEHEVGISPESIFANTTASIIGASVIPTGSLTTPAGASGTKIISTKEGDFYKIQVYRSSTAEDINGLTGIAVKFGGSEHSSVYLAPAAYYREYEYCTYTGTINYYYAGTEEKVVFEDKSDNPYIESVLEAGASKEVISPELKNCTPDQESVTIKIDKENPKDVSYDVYYTCKELYNAKIDYVYEETGEKAAESYYKDNLEDGYAEDVPSDEIEGCVTKDTEVKVNIEGDDFYKKVVYTCEVKENEKTGSFLIYIAWIISLGALGYSAYYFIKLKKTNK